MSEGAAAQPEQQAVDLFSTPGHDRDCARAMHRQAQQRGGITAQQIEHLLQIGYWAGKGATEERAVRAERELAELRDAGREFCRECRDEREWLAPPVPADFILWGKLLPPEAFGPKCYDHAAKHLGRWEMMNIDQCAVFDLRPFRAGSAGSAAGEPT
jgi:hypothetical protein